MHRFGILILVALTCSNITGYGQRADSIYLYNGQVLIGDVQASNLGSIAIDDIDMKIIKVKLYKIRRLRVSELFKINTMQKQTYYGVLEPSDTSGWVTIRTETGESIPLAIGDIHDLITLNKQFFKRLYGNIAAGFSYAKSSDIGQVNFSGMAAFATKHWEYQLQASEIGSIDSSKFSRDNENIQFFGAYNFTTDWFGAGVLQYQRNLELSIARRYLELLGVGNKLFIKDTWQLYVISGLSITQEKSTEGVSSPTRLELPLMLQFNFFKFHNPDIQVAVSWTGYYGLTETGRIRYSGSTSFSWQLIRYFYLTINPYSNFDSKPPSTTASKFDFGVALSLTYKF